MKKLIIPTLALTLLGMSSCQKRFPCVVAKKSTTEETRDVNNFSKIDLCMAADVYFTQDETLTEDQVTVFASENVLKHIRTRVEGNTLIIDSKRCIQGNGNITIHVKSDDLTGVEISGSGVVYGQNPVTTDKMEFDISGSGDIEMELTATSIDADISGSGEMDLIGSASSMDMDISGSGELDAYTLELETADIDISGSGVARVNVSERMDVNISGSGDVYYLGNPSIYQDVSGSGQLHNEN